MIFLDLPTKTWKALKLIYGRTDRAPGCKMSYHFRGVEEKRESTPVDG